MANLKKLEPVAFVLLLIVLCYALLVLAPHSALHDSMAETLAGGATVAVAVALLVLRFQFVKGTPRRYRTETGAQRTFCSRCGTSLTWEHDKRPDEIDITTGSLDHPEDFPPTKDVYPEERLPWVNLIHH